MTSYWFRVAPEQQAKRAEARRRRMQRTREARAAYDWMDRMSHPRRNAAYCRKYDENHRQERRDKAAKRRLEAPEKVKAARERHYARHRAHINELKRVGRVRRRLQAAAQADRLVEQRVADLAANPLSPAQKIDLYRRLEAALPTSIAADTRSEIASLAYIAVYDGKLPVAFTERDLRPIIREQVRIHYGEWTVSLEAVDQKGITLGRRLGVF